MLVSNMSQTFKENNKKLRMIMRLYSVNIAHSWACRLLFSSASLTSCSVRPGEVQMCDQTTYHLWAAAPPLPSTLCTAEGLMFGTVYSVILCCCEWEGPETCIHHMYLFLPCDWLLVKRLLGRGKQTKRKINIYWE